MGSALFAPRSDQAALFQATEQHVHRTALDAATRALHQLEAELLALSEERQDLGLGAGAVGRVSGHPSTLTKHYWQVKSTERRQQRASVSPKLDCSMSHREIRSQFWTIPEDFFNGAAVKSD